MSGGVEFGGCGVSQVSPTDTTTLGTTIILPCPVTAASLYTQYLNIHCVTTPLQHHLDQVWPRTAETPSVCTHSFQANIARYEDINSFDNYNNVYDYTYEYPVSALTPPDREGEQRRSNTGWYSISKDRTQLTLPRVTRTEEGLYSCEITKQAGSTRRIFRVCDLQ
ncbi:hypothetical protein Pcinc_025537 [Petrolisthes cinctipes]|uniref:Ig-like domain-containing protein n=1 Tax=Petrolisthes cinctipes TaxID=88211 RepID=A0AAE1K9C2_PETCI|nr:hypothetical protein Pcinc_025537 [Petrolisthes cinctipes]